MAKALLDQLSPLLLQALGIIGTALLAWIGTAIQARTNSIKQANYREALHSALNTGALAAATAPNTNVRAIASEAVEYANKSVPDAIKALRPSVEVMSTLARAKASQALSAKQTMVSKT